MIGLFAHFLELFLHVIHHAALVDKGLHHRRKHGNTDLIAAGEVADNASLGADLKLVSVLDLFHIVAHFKKHEAHVEGVTVENTGEAVAHNSLDASEEVIGEDPDAPKGDGGITLDFDYAAGCDAQLTDLSNMLIVPTSERVMSIKHKAEVPNGILKFNVSIESTSDAFKLALAAADAFNLDLINPKAAHDVIFQVVPFPHGPELSGKTEVAFDLSAAQSAITAYPGKHDFIMTIVDETFCTKTIPVTMIVE